MILAVAVIFLSVLAAYHNCFRAPFVFDDFSSIRDNLSIRRLWPVWGALLPPHAGTTVGGRPVANLTLAANYAVSGTGVWSYHAANVLIHALGGLTLFGIVRRTLMRPVLSGRFGRDALPLALAIAVLWAVHPLQTESVTYVIQRVESLMGLFYLLTLYCLIRSVESARPFPWQACTVAACLLGMATKEVMATAPLVGLLYDRTFVAGTFRSALRQRYGLYLALAATWLPLPFLVASTGWSRSSTAGFDGEVAPGSYWLAQSGAVARYLWLSTWPHPLVFDYGTVLLRRPGESALCALGVVPIAAATLVSLRRRPELGFLGAWFFLILAPTSVVPVATQAMAEHRMYLPLAAVVAVIVLGGYAYGGRRIWVPLASLALVFVFLTASRNEDYRSEATLWGDTVAKQPNNERAHCALGSALNSIPGRLPEAISEFEAALRIRPRYAFAHNGLGVAFQNLRGRSDEAIREFRDAIGIEPTYALAHFNLGVVLAQSGRVQEAMREFEAALRLNPTYADAHNNLGVALCVSGRLAEGIHEIETALRINPDYATAHFNLGNALVQLGQDSEAIHQFEEAVGLQADYAEANNNLGLALCRMGRAPEGIEHIRAAIRENPDYAGAHLALGAALLQQGRKDEAAAEFERVLELAPGDPSASRMLEQTRRAH